MMRREHPKQGVQWPLPVPTPPALLQLLMTTVNGNLRGPLELEGEAEEGLQSHHTS